MNNIRSPRTPLLLAAFVMIGAAGCQSARNFTIFSTAQEVEIGQQVSAEIERQNRMLADPAVVGYVSQVGAKVAAKAARQDVTYSFKVIDSPNQINAFAVPGGNIYIYSGLLRQMKTESELAAVLGHEVAHISLRHSMKRLTRQTGFELVLAVVLGENSPAWQSTVGKLVGNVAFLQFSKAEEEDADRDGLTFMYNAGYDPHGMVNLLTMFTTLQQSEPSKIEVFLSSHPAPQERVGIVKKLITTENLDGGIINENEYESVIKKLK
ncbi:MAG TPA: M48 family metallopeptidase [Planctomycetota bacterium]|nr:M48 family metallopeptidase [Planctomycetota bacterium]